MTDALPRTSEELVLFFRDEPGGRKKYVTLIPGTHAALAAGMDAYHAANLREALKLVPDTGDWHGSLRIVCDMVLERDGRLNPNQTAEQMAERFMNECVRHTSEAKS